MRMTWIRISFEYLHLMGTFIKLSCLNQPLLFSFESVYILVFMYVLGSIRKKFFYDICKKINGLDANQTSMWLDPYQN